MIFEQCLLYLFQQAAVVRTNLMVHTLPNEQKQRSHICELTYYIFMRTINYYRWLLCCLIDVILQWYVHVFTSSFTSLLNQIMTIYLENKFYF